MMGNFRGSMANRGGGDPNCPPGGQPQPQPGGPGPIQSAMGARGGQQGGGMAGMMQRLMAQRGGQKPQPDPRIAQFNRQNPMPGGGDRMVTGDNRGMNPMMQKQQAMAQRMRGGGGGRRMGGPNPGGNRMPMRGGMRGGGRGMY